MGLDERDAAFVERLRNLAQDALTWPHLGERQRLVWAAAMELNAVPFQELPPWFWERQNSTRRHSGLDLLSLDGSRAVCCWNASVSFKEVRRFLRMARWVYKAPRCTVVTSSRPLPKKVKAWLNCNAEHRVITNQTMTRLGAAAPSAVADNDGMQPPLRQCQRDCLDACAKGARVVEMACGTGKTRVIQELVSNVSGRVLIMVPLRALLDQFAPDFPGFCKVGMGHNKKIDFDGKGFIAVTDSVHLLKKLKFHSIFVDEGHNPLPSKMPKSTELYRFSATHKDEPDFRYTMGQAIEDGILCDYDITVPALTAHHAYVCLADLLLKQVGRFRRVLAYCNAVAEAKRFRMVLRKLGLAAWHINGKTPLKKRVTVIEEFAGPLLQPVHVLVTVEVLGEGINIPNADTCMFVEPRSSYRSIIQAIGRVLRHHPAKTLAHIVLPAVAIPSSRSVSILQSGSSNKEINGGGPPNGREPESLQIPRRSNPQSQAREGELPTIAKHKREKLHERRTGEDVPSRLRLHAASSVDAPPADTRRQAETFHPAFHSNSQQIEEVRSNWNENFDASLLKRKPGSGNYDEIQTQVSPSTTAAMTDRQQDRVQQEHLQTKCGSMKKTHRHQPARRLKQAVQNQYLERFIPGTCDPTTPGRPGGVGSGNEHDEPVMQKTQATMGSKIHQTFTVKASGRSSMFDQQFGSQLGRFLAVLMRADQRLVGEDAQNRIQVVDCTLADAGASIMEGWTTEIYNRLSAILSREDYWECRLRSLEAFVEENGRIPSRQRNFPHYERSLSLWLNGQCTAFREQRLPLQRFQKLLASVPLVRRRAKGWQTGDTDGLFVESCNQLKEYVQLHHRLPGFHQRGSSSWKLAKWLANVRVGNGKLDAGKMKMLQKVHPLVKAEVQKWQDAPQLWHFRWEQKFGQLSRFVSATGRLPKSGRERKLEKSCYDWLRVQCRKLQVGCLPDDMVRRLRDAHRLISEYIDAYAERLGARHN